MKKAFATIMTGIMCCAVFAGCAGSSKITDNIELPAGAAEASQEEVKPEQKEQESESKPEAEAEADLSTQEVQKGRAVVFDVTVSEGLPNAVITVSMPRHDDVTWDVVQISGRIPQRSTFVD